MAGTPSIPSEDFCVSSITVKFPDSATYHGVAESFDIVISRVTHCAKIELSDPAYAVTISSSNL
jgi:hypothetical protein